MGQRSHQSTAKLGEKEHKEFDSMLGIDVYDKLKDDKANAGNSDKGATLYAICQDVGILGEMAVAMSMYDTQVSVSFQSQFPIYKILEAMFKLLKAVDNYESDSQKAEKTGQKTESLPLHGLDTLRDNVTAAGQNFERI